MATMNKSPESRASAQVVALPSLSVEALAAHLDDPEDLVAALDTCQNDDETWRLIESLRASEPLERALAQIEAERLVKQGPAATALANARSYLSRGDVTGALLAQRHLIQAMRHAADPSERAACRVLAAEVDLLVDDVLEELADALDEDSMIDLAEYRPSAYGVER